MAMLHRKGSQDRIVIYDCFTASWEAVQQVQCPETSYLEDISFAPIKETALDGRPPVVAWEGPAFTGRMFVFAADGQSCKVITREGEDVLFSMGSARLTWSGDGLVAACIHNGESLTIWNAISQKMSPRIHVGPAAAGGQEHGRQGSGRVVVFKERITRELSSPHGTIVDRSKCKLFIAPICPEGQTRCDGGRCDDAHRRPLRRVRLLLGADAAESDGERLGEQRPLGGPAIAAPLERCLFVRLAIHCGGLLYVRAAMWRLPCSFVASANRRP